MADLDWTTLSDTRLTSGKAWSPELSLAYHENAMELWRRPVDFSISTVNISGATPQSGNFNIYIRFPDSWDIDNEFDPDIRLYLRIGLLIDIATTGSSPVLTVDFNVNEDEIATTSSATPTWDYLSRYWTSALPTGWQTLQVDWTASAISGTLSGTIERGFGARGSDSGLRVSI